LLLFTGEVLPGMLLLLFTGEVLPGILLLLFTGAGVGLFTG
jgi:hypothetical protein